MTIPNPLTGTSLQANWLNRLRGAVFSDRLIGGAGYRVRRTTSGTALELLPSFGGGTGAPVTMYMIVSIQNEYATCKTWDGTRTAGVPQLGSSDVLIAKHRPQRMSISQEVIDGVTINYVYSDSNNRSANDGTQAEAQVCYPRYKAYSGGTLVYPGSVIVAGQPSNGTDVANVTWQELSPGRVWARRYLQ